VRDRLAGLLDEEALEEAVQGLKPEELTGAWWAADPTVFEVGRQPGQA